MKKKLLLIAGILAGSLFFSGVYGSQIAQALDNFTITNYDVEMKLGRDSENRSTLHVVETITANFTRRNENRGLERAFVKTYENRGTSFDLESVTDENGRKLSYHWSGDTLRIGDKDRYVYGPQTYKITYTQRDITKHYEDTAKDEFYWDVIGGDWRVPIQQASVRLELAPEIRSAVQTDAQCYSGRFGSTDRCQIEGSDGVYVVEAQNIGNRAGITVAIGFASETFASYQEGLAQRLFKLWVMSLILTTFVGVFVIVWLSMRAQRFKYRTNELGTIVPEYLPPKNASVAASAAVVSGITSVMAAELTDLAVRRYIQILETKPKRSFWRSAEYDIKVVKDIASLRQEEQEILFDMYGKRPSVGERLPLKQLQNNTSAYTRFSDNDKKLRELMRSQYELKHVDETARGWFVKASIVLLVAGLVTLGPLLLVASLVAFIISRTLWVLSDEGLALQRYVKGLEMYIKVAEKDRIKMLQSPEGAEKVDIDDPTDPAQLVKLYEKVLPYAILFRQEKEWSQALGNYYEQSGSNPNWYAGSTAFNAIAFSSAMSSFSTSVASTSASSSSSGGSSGGGFSGGGGGGGGGGGW